MDLYKEIEMMIFIYTLLSLCIKNELWWNT